MARADALAMRPKRPDSRAREHEETLRKIRRADAALQRSASRRASLLRAAELYRQRMEGR